MRRSLLLALLTFDWEQPQPKKLVFFNTSLISDQNTYLLHYLAFTWSCQRCYALYVQYVCTHLSYRIKTQTYCITLLLRGHVSGVMSCMCHMCVVL